MENSIVNATIGTIRGGGQEFNPLLLVSYDIFFGQKMVLIVTPTYHKREKFLNLLFEFLGKAWSNHPPVWFITDGNGIRHKNIIRIKSENWVVRLHDGLRKLKTVCPELTHVFLLIEDNYPLSYCDVERIIDVEETMLRENLNCVVFAPYEFKGEEKIRVEKGELCKVPSDFRYYSQVQPSLWKFDHLIQTCQIALEEGVSDCWRFESIVTDGHYVSDYRWPTRLDGLFSRGFVNTAALNNIKMPEGRRLKEKIIQEMVLDFPGYIFLRMTRGLRRWIDRLKTEN